MLTVHHSKQKVVTLERTELFFLAGILGSDRLLGIDDPFVGYLTEDIVKEWDKVKETLLQKGYLIQDEGSSDITMTPTVFSRVAIAGLSSRAFRFQLEEKGSSYEGYLHCTNERVVEVIRTQEEPITYQLSDLGNVEQACENVVNRINWSSENISENIPALMFSKKKFYENMKQHQEWGTLSKALAEDCHDSQGADALAKTIVEQQSEGEFQLLVWNGHEWESQSAAFISDASANWLLRMSTVGKGDWLVASPATKEQFKDMLLDWLNQPVDHEER
ncbi:hypothetical protein [Paenibacillus sp. Marseille-Q4541]|uniref:hypothetical protein n=1 Tax=Paenibacillus sp. Marseille-Q4541 TaxID=2831522 RepID=UPI001BA7714B|nr:hypothetical protein [Paenibacillus sp. Marseille-Q4541]